MINPEKGVCYLERCGKRNLTFCSICAPSVLFESFMSMFSCINCITKILMNKIVKSIKVM